MVRLEDMSFEVWSSYNLLGSDRPQSSFRKRHEQSQTRRAQSVFPSGREGFSSYHSSNVELYSRPRKPISRITSYADTDEESSGTDEFHTPNQGGSQKRVRSTPQFTPIATKRHQSERPTRRFTTPVEKRSRKSFLDDNITSKPRTSNKDQYALDVGAGKSGGNTAHSSQREVGQDGHISNGHGNFASGSNILTPQSPNNLQLANQTPEPISAVKRSRAGLLHGKDGAIPPKSLPHVSNKESPKLDYSQRTTGSNQASLQFRVKSAAPAILSDVGDARNLKRQASSQLLASSPKKLQLEQPLWPNKDGSDSSSPHLSEFPQVQGLNGVQHATGSYRKAALMKPNNKSPTGKSATPIPSNGRSIGQTPQKIDLPDDDSDDDLDNTWEASYRKSRKSRLKVACSPYHHSEVLPTKSAFAKKKSAKDKSQDPSSRSRKSITIDLDTSEIEKDNRPTRQFLPSNNWRPRGRTIDRNDSTLFQAISRKPTADKGASQLPTDVQRQKKAAELIVTKEFDVEFGETQQAIFGEVLPESEKEKQEREQAKRIEKQKARESEEKKRAAEEELKRKREKLRAERLLEKQAAEKREKEQREVERKARLAKERERQAQVELDLAKKRREDEELRKQKAAVALKQKEEREKQQAAEKRKEDEILRLKLEVQQRDKLLAAQSAQKLVPAKIAKANGAKSLEVAVASASSNLPPKNSAVPDDGDDLFISDIQGESRATASSPMFSDLDDLFGESKGTDENLSSDPPAGESMEEASVNILDKHEGTLSNQHQEKDHPISVTQGPSSAAEIFARMNPGPQKDREVEREANRRDQIQKRASQSRLGRETTAPAAASTEIQVEAHPANISSKPRNESEPKKKAGRGPRKSAENPMAAIFATKLIPLHPVGNRQDIVLPTQRLSSGERKITEPSSITQNPAIQRSTDTNKKSETVLISAAKVIELEARRARIEAEAQAKKKASKLERNEATKKERYDKATVALRMRHEARIKEKALKDGKLLTSKEIQDEVDKFVAKRDRDNERRRQQMRGIEPPSAETTQTISSPAQETGSPFSKTSHGQEEDDGPEAVARKEREAEAAMLVERMKKNSAHNKRFSRTASRQEERHVDTDSESDSDESEEDPDDDDELADMRAQLSESQSDANDPIKPSRNRDDYDSETGFTDEESGVPQPNSDDSGTQISQLLPDKISFSGGTVTQKPVDDMGFLAAQLQISSNLSSQTLASSSAEYKMVNVFYVMSRELIEDYVDPPNMLKSFQNLDKANKYAQALVNGHRNKKNGRIGISEEWDPKTGKYSADITHNKSKITRYYIMKKALKPTEIENYDPTQIKPKVANKLWLIKCTTTTRENDPITNSTKEKEVVTLPKPRAYTVSEMANHDACEYLLEQIKPGAEQDERYHVQYEEEIAPLARSGRDECNRVGNLFDMEVDTTEFPWICYDGIEVEVDEFETIGPIN